jgi:hypothetical protein
VTVITGTVSYQLPLQSYKLGKGTAKVRVLYYLWNTFFWFHIYGNKKLLLLLSLDGVPVNVFGARMKDKCST